MPTPTKSPRGARQPAPLSNFVIKTENDDGTVTWVDPETLDEITLNHGTAPTRELLAALAANGIVPKPPTIDDEPRGPVQVLDSLPPDDFEDDALSRVLTRIKTTATAETRSEVKIYRVKADGKESYCGRFSIEEYDEFGDELIRQHFGAGSYRVRVYGPSLQPDGVNYGKFVRLTNTLVEIEPSLLPIKSNLPGVPNAPDGGAVSAIMPILNQLTQEIVNLKTQPQKDPMEELARMARVMREMGLTGGGRGGGSVVEQIKEMRALMGITKDLEVERGGSGDSGGKPDDMMGMASKVLDLLGQNRAVEPAPAMIPAQVPTVAIPPGMYPAQPVADPFNQPAESEPAVNPIQQSALSVLVGALVRAAERGDAIEQHAEGLADKLPDEVIDMLETPLWFDMLCASLSPELVQRVEARKPWFTQMRDKVLELVYAEEPEPAPGAAPAA